LTNRRTKLIVSTWFINESQPSIETLFKIAKVLGVEAREVAGRNEIR
jgi:transcriptional regulator with XRE-family HTH domain